MKKVVGVIAFIFGTFIGLSILGQIMRLVQKVFAMNTGTAFNYGYFLGRALVLLALAYLAYLCFKFGGSMMKSDPKKHLDTLDDPTSE